MASVSDREIFDPSLLQCEILYNCCCFEVDVDKVFVNLSSHFDRKPLQEDMEKDMEKTWQERTYLYPSLYNGTKFRLNDVTLTDGCVILNVGMTCYRDFICTNLRPDLRERIRTWGSKYHGNPHACFADPIGVNGLVLSSDDKAVLIRRSQQLFEYPGMMHTPGGHPEPNEMKDENNEVLPLNDMDPKQVVHEFFYSIQKEVRDEVNLPIESLSWPILLGILRNEQSSGRPEICFLLRCSLSSKEIKVLYDKGGPEAFESSEIAFLGISELKEQTRSYEVTRLLDEMASPAKTTLHFYLKQNCCTVP